jgi:hypothetical protein
MLNDGIEKEISKKNISTNINFSNMYSGLLN